MTATYARMTQKWPAEGKPGTLRSVRLRASLSAYKTRLLFWTILAYLVVLTSIAIGPGLLGPMRW